MVIPRCAPLQLLRQVLRHLKRTWNLQLSGVKVAEAMSTSEEPLRVVLPE